VSVLYPRLLDQTARELHEQYIVAKIEDLQRKAAYRHPSAVFTATGGQRVGTEQLADLRDAVVRAAADTGFPVQGGKREHAEFDLRVARLLHEKSGLVPAEASVRSAWAFLALVLLPDVTYWRFPSAPGDRVLATDITRHVFGRLWWRAHLLEDPDSSGDRYELLQTFGESAFDQIFARRRALGGSRPLIRALARTWPSLSLHGLSERAVLREVLKRFRRLGTLIDFEALDDAQLGHQVAAVTRETVAALRPRAL